jgi:hypothetical protein
MTYSIHAVAFRLPADSTSVYVTCAAGDSEGFHGIAIPILRHRPIKHKHPLPVNSLQLVLELVIRGRNEFS